ncbi:stearoyl-CoA desaturase (delta-9 desaturase) [Mariniflexile fucanivorans]|uniref:Stearoyl-CoA desaturase (Delta-9 desaturase) n=1 Tax=Mariniflexile fucanivorans TaxID=264023 RepID=A0A4R1RL48_9FLAO|nr:acyl-CoA desaturase [Mariniflexile fucanivorans]TCL66759.1 stearoyl-CoA desaturase (delta-9 desaturase) [Mariniflexile fucanivorans]
MAVLFLLIILWYGGLFFQTFFLHRYAAHQTFTMSKTAEKMTYVLTWLFQGSNYLSAYGYGVMHRMHHAYADTEKDPHSPKFDENVLKMMWRTKNVYQDINRQRIAVEEKFTKNVPQWLAFDRMASSRVSRIIWTALYITFFILFATAWWQWLFLPVIVLMAPIHGVIINWYAHIYGYVNFKVKDTSKNLLPFDFLMMGEAYHNNHHKHGGRANFGVRWHEFDPTYFIMRILNKVGIIKFVKN